MAKDKVVLIMGAGTVGNRGADILLSLGIPVVLCKYDAHPDDIKTQELKSLLERYGGTEVGKRIRTYAARGSRVDERAANLDKYVGNGGGSIEDLCGGGSPPEYTPFSPLAPFVGGSSLGTWTLTVTDNAGADLGTLQGWSLRMVPVLADIDGDGVPDVLDNCRTVTNPGQRDADGDGYGNRCDNCPSIHNPDQIDEDHNGVGDICEERTVIAPIEIGV